MATFAEAGTEQVPRQRLPLGELLHQSEALQAARRPDEAIALLREWASDESNADRHVVWFNLGSILQARLDLPGARSAYECSLAAMPGFAHAVVNLGLVCETMGLIDEALSHWVGLVGQKLRNPAVDDALVVIALNHIGRVQENRKQYDLAEEALAQSLRLDPRQTGVLQHWIHIRQKACRWPVYAPLPGIGVNAMLMATSPLAMLALEDDPLRQLLVAHAFVARTYGLKEEFLSRRQRHAHDRLRVGYVSGDLCVHAVGLLLAELIEGHDRSRFEIYAYDFSPEDGSAQRARLVAAFDQFRSIAGLDDGAAAQRVLEDEIDILVDLHGLSAGARPGIFSRHPAPLQGTYLGFMGTTGMPWFDFVIVDRYAMPASLESYFPERPLRVEGCFIPLPAGPADAGAMRREALGLPADAFVMAAFGNAYKINPVLFDTWLAILARIPNAVLWLLDDNPVATVNLKRRAEAARADVSRIVFSPRVSHGEFCSRLKLADVFLDTFPYNCGSTANDVIQANLALVSMSGKSLVARMGGSILMSVGRGDLIASSPGEYADLVVGLHAGRIPRANYGQGPAASGRDALVRSIEAGFAELACGLVPGMRPAVSRAAWGGTQAV